MVKAKAFLVCLSVIAACATPITIENPRQVWCENNDPRRDATEETPRRELDAINAHNRQGVLWCDWEP